VYVCLCVRESEWERERERTRERECVCVYIRCVASLACVKVRVEGVWAGGGNGGRGERGLMTGCGSKGTQEKGGGGSPPAVQAAPVRARVRTFHSETRRCAGRRWRVLTLPVRPRPGPVEVEGTPPAGPLDARD
jgi:hypothetical protein